MTATRADEAFRADPAGRAEEPREQHQGPGPGPARSRRAPWRRPLPVHWPLTATLLGYPLWWLLGIAWVVPILAAGVMALQLARRRTVRTPPGFVVLLLFLAWVVLSAAMLWVDAPTAVSGGAGPGRVAVFGYRVAWYGTAVIVLLWVGNLTGAELPRRWVRSCLAFLFLVTAAGGLLGVLIPTVDFPSALELLLPGGLRQNPFVSSLVHPGLADIESVLGTPGPRPKAPFDFTNTWGANFALLLPFFLTAWWREGRRWQHLATPPILALSAIPVVYSLNRGLWASLVVGLVVLLALLAVRGRRAPLVLTAAVVAAMLLAVLLSPLGSIFENRLQTPHSNERRTLLLEQTVTSTATGSPVLGFGTTRDVQGNYSSISGGATPDCDACGVPPLGTQGQLWMVIFSQGLVGAGLFLAFLAASLARTWRARTTNEATCLFVLVAFGLQLLVYDTLGIPLMTVMIAIALVWREQQVGARTHGKQGPGSSVTTLVRNAREQAWVLIGFTLAGLVLGVTAVAAADDEASAARVAVLLVPAPVALPAAELPEDEAARRATIDTEAALVVSAETMRRVVGPSVQAAEELRSRTLITAPPSSRVLVIEVRSPNPAVAEREASALATSYLRTRRGYLKERRQQAITEVERALRSSDPDQLTDELVDPEAAAADEEAVTPEVDSVTAQEALDRLRGTAVQAGQVLRTSSAEPVRAQREIPLVSGLALGLLAGTAVVAVRSRRGRPA